MSHIDGLVVKVFRGHDTNRPTRLLPYEGVFTETELNDILVAMAQLAPTVRWEEQFRVLHVVLDATLGFDDKSASIIRELEEIASPAWQRAS